MGGINYYLKIFQVKTLGVKFVNEREYETNDVQILSVMY